ncbi:hypothetical protein MJO29_002909 [Puccinia striiformis f. sp. tritici]|uniref:Inner centromere protein ARK-binding domain-containing protein n=1 Tax=Puccinia striiformis f. sp. tritici PST-78 TaxID=1165861 RepID=A0A0L0VK90_9BASI|nr:hypothetical protein Pst134EB_006276 [Puccinia striiformis f. sp. tritici]KAI7964811.1 hypothetical protein MJO29_002909 [Puccinia striiformis f. sp. tritici]KAI9619307.1 hypothetical protein H4Q26_011991 [Puccinia striiformis f. sp. tritici PST-130]KNE99631.1 hypothetical protein PSTG_07124 [Puccinia striiformis f. sp. tritici PST-78]
MEKQEVAAIPEDIRLKTSYYAHEIRNQVSSLYQEQHRWLEDHLSEIKHTLTKPNENKNKAGTRAVMAGIIKTPSRKRTKKKISKPDLQPLAELKRSNLNINNQQIQDIIHQQLEKEKKEIELRLQKELSSLDHQYQSPVKKTAGSSTLISADQSKPTPLAFWNPAESILPSQINLSSSLSAPIKINDDNIFSLATSSNKRTEDFNQSLIPFPQQDDTELEDAEPSHESATDPSDVFAAAGHELSAIQEGEEEDDHHSAEPLPSIPKSFLSAKSAPEVSASPKQPSNPQPVTSVSVSPPLAEPPSPPPQSKSVATPTTSTPPPKPQSPPSSHHNTTRTEHFQARVEETQPPAFSSDSLSAPDTNSVDAIGFDSDPITHHVPNSVKAQVVNVMPSDMSQATLSNLVQMPTSDGHIIQAPLDLRPTNSTAPSTASNVSSGAVNKSLTPEHVAIDTLEEPRVLPSNPEQGQGNVGRPTSSLSTATSMVKQEPEEPTHHPQPQEAPRSSVPIQQPHVDTVVEVPLSDNPSNLRNNLFASIGPSSHPDKLAEHQTRTPGAPISSNLFTPGNPRAAIIQSPHSQWSTKPSGALWTQHKPHKTPGALSNLGPAGPGEWTKAGFTGSPFEDLSKPINLLSNLQSTTAQQNLISDTPFPQPPSSAIDSQHPRRSGLKRTSTDAGFSHTTEAHDAKMSRSHTPGMMHFRPSATGTTSKKGMEDLKSRLSKIQRESAMHERVHHHLLGPSADAPLIVNPRTSLVTQTSAPSFSKALPLAVSTTTKGNTPELRNNPQTFYRDFSAPIDLSSSSKMQPTHPPSTEPINLQSRGTTFEPLTTSSSKPSDENFRSDSRNSQSIEPQTEKKRASSSSSFGNLIALEEPKSQPMSTKVPLTSVAQVTGLSSPAEITSLLPTTKVDSKHLAFLRGDINTHQSSSPHPSTSTVLDKAVDHQHVPETIDQGYHSVDSEHNEPEQQAQEGSDDDAGEEDQQEEEQQQQEEDCQSVVSSKLSETIEIDHEHDDSQVLSSEDHHHHVQEKEGSEERDDQEGSLPDENTFDDPSVEIVSSKAQRVFNNNHHSDHEQDSRDRQILNQMENVRKESELTRTPLNNNNKNVASSPASTGFMGVFKAGAALASSWTNNNNNKNTNNKSERPELKSLQLAAVAAKKEQDERDRKAALKEERRLLAVEKKQAEEKIKNENERKARLAEVEKKKVERDEASKVRSTFKVKVATNHPAPASRQPSMTGDLAKKRKIDNNESNSNTNNRTIEAKKTKPPTPIESQGKIPTSAQKVAHTGSYLPTRTAPVAPGSAMKPSGSKSTHLQSTSNLKTNPPGSSSKLTNPPSRPVSQLSQYTGGLPKSTTGTSSSSSHQQHNNQSSSTTNHSSMIKGKIREEKQMKVSVVIPSDKNRKEKEKQKEKEVEVELEKEKQEEYIELPDIDSEYSDDDQSEHERKESKLPDWAQSPALREALNNQRKVNPDDVFGGIIPPPRMDEIFRGRQSKFRHRTSSANWTGTDQLTAIEEAEYAKRMGYHNQKKRSIRGKDR